MKKFSDIFKTLKSYSREFEDAFCYTIKIKAGEVINKAVSRKNLSIKDNFKHVYNITKMIAILYNENIVGNLHRMIFELLMEIKQSCNGEKADDHEGLYVMLKLFMEIKKKYKREHFETFLQIMDVIYGIKENQKTTKNLEKLLKIKKVILNDFETLTQIDPEGGPVNPSMRFAIFLMINMASHDRIQFSSFDVVNAKEAANCFFYHAIQFEFKTKEFTEFLTFWSKIETKTKERSRFLPEIVNLCMRNFIEQHVQKKASLSPVNTIATAKFAAKIFAAGIIQKEIYMKFIEMVADHTAIDLCDLNYR